ncbi:proline-rich protein 3 isoform e [Mus musculus]|uniref:proline-rich protein 3 isoform e n=1 Tax=Mus musculus TaxID=10090 RepID=UPI0003D6DD86|nr:proline-rich protein 3 isoform e [Mus musculus]
MPKRKKQDQPPPLPQQQQHLALSERDEPGDEEDERPMGPPSLLGPPPMANGKPGDPKSDKSDRPVCRHFSKKGHCRYEDHCAFYHPGVNGPPL